MPQFIAVNHSVCTGCRECEVVCSLYHFGECNPERSAVRVIRKEEHGLPTTLPLVCQQCDDPPCLEACPVGALSRDEGTALLSVDPEVCTGCGDCFEACPAGCIFMDVRREVAILCDLCGGQPQCVDFCHSNCLTLADSDAPDVRDRLTELAGVLDKEGLQRIRSAKGVS